MDSNDIKLMKDKYCESLNGQGYKDKAAKIESGDIFSPVYDPLYLHPEQELDPKDLNLSLNDVACDLNIMNTELCKAAADVKNLMVDINSQLQVIENTILLEKENQQDLNILCNNSNGFDSVIKLSPNDFSGSFTSDDNTLYMCLEELNKVQTSIASVSGNGFEGNKYVYNNGVFQSDVINTSNRSFINDGSIITIYEYSRITADSSEKDIPPEINFDSLEATCSIVLKADNNINMLKIISNSNNLNLLSVETSDDGIVFTKQNKETLNIKTLSKEYTSNNYIPGSGIICFPETQYVKLVLQSVGYTSDSIMFNKTIIED